MDQNQCAKGVTVWSQIHEHGIRWHATLGCLHYGPDIYNKPRNISVPFELLFMNDINF